MSRLEHCVVGMLENNCYFVQPDDGGTLYIIDPAAEPDALEKQARDFSFDHAVVLLTHAHVDHIGALGEIVRRLGVRQVFLREADLPLYQSSENAIPPWLPAAKDLPATEAPVSCEDYEVLETPGHTPGGCCYYFPALPGLFSGDTLFRYSVGRTDMPGGSHGTLMRSIREQLMPLPDDLAVYPGHGPATTVGAEKKGNPYLV